MKSSHPLTASKHQFVTLDALRGIAALGVVFYHSNTLSAHLFQHAFIAVDFFFILSGFVLSYSYGKRLAEGWSAFDFMRTRYIRLMPLAVLAMVAMFALSRVFSGVLQPPIAAHNAFWILPLNFFFLPILPGQHGYAMFPYNVPAWTLYFELISNLVHVLFLRRVRTATLAVITALFGVALLGCMLRAGTGDIGFYVFRLDGYARVMFSYCLGMLLYRAWQAGHLRWKLSPALVCSLLVVVIAFSVPRAETLAYSLLSVFLLLPCVVMLGIGSRNDARYARGLQMLGAASYAIYVLQLPVLILLDLASEHLTHRPLHMNRPWSGLIVIVVLVGLSLLADAYFDVPLRKRLRKRKVVVLPDRTTVAAP